MVNALYKSDILIINIVIIIITINISSEAKIAKIKLEFFTGFLVLLSLFFNRKYLHNFFRVPAAQKPTKLRLFNDFSKILQQQNKKKEPLVR